MQISDSSRDILSDVLQSVRLSGAIFFDVSTRGPWVAAAPPGSEIASAVMPGAQHVIEYHVVTRGECWACLSGQRDDPVRVLAGSVIMFPQGDAHVLSTKPGMVAEPNYALFHQPEALSPPYLIEAAGKGPEETEMICGFIGCDILPFNPVIQALPRLLHLPDAYSRKDGWLRDMIRIIQRESRNRRAGSQSVLARLSELLFIEVVRCYSESLPTNANGWLAALADPRIGRAIRLLHRHPENTWKVETLAREVGVSRTVLTECFTRNLGLAPMAYLSQWRMQIAARMLSDGNNSLARIAEDVGYESEAAFSRSFKRATGSSPGAWRNRSMAAIHSSV